MDESFNKQIKEQLKCHFCSLKVKNPRMCLFCKKLFCSDCIKNWLSLHDYCFYCRKKIKDKDFIILPFFEDMSEFFIRRENPKNKNKSISTSKIEIKQASNKMEEKYFQNICQKHFQNLEYYCIDCDKYLCSLCLIIFNQEWRKHNGHLIIETKKIEEYPVKELINKIINLEKELTKEKNKNKEYETIILNLKKDINYGLQINNEMKKQLDYKNILKKYLEEESKDSLIEKIIENEKKIKELERQLSRIPFKIEEGEELISITFISLDEKVLFSEICKNTDEFNKIEKQLYQLFPEYNGDDIYFSFKGKKINRKNTLEQNGIKNNDFIIINKFT